MTRMDRENLIGLLRIVPEKLRAAGLLLSDLIYPPVCVFCGLYCDCDICEGCIKLVERSGKERKNLSTMYGYGEFYYYARYSGAVKELVQRYKFRGEMWLGRRMGSVLFSYFKDELVDYDGIVYVPAGRNSLRKRGFDQCAEIAFELSKKMDTEVFAVLESASGKTRQSRLKRDRRKDNATGRFRLKESAGQDRINRLKGSRLLLIDDILTTGSTIRECAAILIESCGAASVDAMVFATGRTDIG